MNLISSCFTTEELIAENIALIERLDNKRNPLLYLHATYILIPSEQNIELLLQDFAASNYKRVHLLFLSAVPDDMFNSMASSINPFKVLTFSELDMLFLPKESQVFTLQDHKFFSTFYNSYSDVSPVELERVAKKLVTVFSVLGVVPLIRYRRNFVKNFIFAETLQKELNAVKESIWKITPKAKNRCQVLILDRGFDCISPLLHEFTFQAMAYDVLDIKDDIYEFTLTQGREVGTTQKILLTEDDPLWCQLRHEHMADVAKLIQNKVETDTLMEKTSFIRQKGIPNLSDTIKQFILSKRNETFYSYRHMANECMKQFCAGLNNASDLEQNLAIGTTFEGKQFGRPLSNVMTVISDPTLDLNVKLRLLLLYIFFEKGISKQQFEDIMKEAQIPFSAASKLANILHLDTDLFHPGRCIAVHDSSIERSQDTESTYKQSRWKPLLRDILINCVQKKLDEDQFPFLNKYQESEGLIPPVQRTSYWHADKRDENAFKLIVFIIGGPTYSEIRCTYEVMKKYPGWDIFIGGDILLTPNKFLDKLSVLPPLI
ncbi:protein ROP isoform X2 [Parasteatoda tepidariorum]|nr:protein ROP isoform X2 [Parasteatoda tepidariorum]